MQNVLNLRKIRDFGENLSDTIQFLKFNWKKLIILYAVFVVPLLLVATLLGASSFASLFASFTRGGTSSFPDVAEIFNVQFFIAIILFFLSSASYGTVVFLYMRLYEENNGVQPGIADVGKLFLPKLLSNFGMTILVGLMMSISALIAIIPILGWLLVFCGFIYLAITFSLLYPINTIESNDIFTSIRRSFFLIRNKWWYSFGYLIVLVMIYYFFSVVISLVVNLIFGFSSVNFVDPDNTSVFTEKYFLVTGISAIFQQIFYLIIYVGIGMYYFSIREEKEGSGLEERLEQLGGGGGVHGQIEEQY